jgi:hypothetical protein
MTESTARALPPDEALFSADYARARTTFLAAATAAGAQLASHVLPAAPCPGREPPGETLVTDVAWLGPRSAESVLMLVSGTHGIEGYAGSACQASLLASGLPGSADTATLLVHALNPYGFANGRRVNEDNVDLNRNFVDHAAPPHNLGYDGVHDALVPTDWTGTGRAAADQWLVAYIQANGARALQAAVTQGQYRHPDGLFYGGTAPAWSNTVLATIAGRYLTECRYLAYIDLHTGLGAFAVGEPIFRGGLDAGALQRARRWYGAALTVSQDGTSSSTPIIGNTASMIASSLRRDQVLTAITLEFGTLSAGAVLTALRADNWLHLQDAPEIELARQIGQQIRDAFCPADPAWRTAVLARSREVADQALAGLAAQARLASRPRVSRDRV